MQPKFSHVPALRVRFASLVPARAALACLCVLCASVALAGEPALSRSGGDETAAKAFTPLVQPFAGERIYLGGAHPSSLQMPVTAFNHAGHAKLVPCADCHSVLAAEPKPGEPAPQPALATFAGITATDPVARKNALHEACASCHVKRSFEGKRGPALAECRACHTVSDPAALPGKPYKPAFTTSLHERHLLSGDFPAAPMAGLAASAILAEDVPERCRACHHSPRHDKDLPPRVDACRACHVSGPGTGTLADPAEGAPPSLRLAAHATCMPCHLAGAAQQKAHGPLDCAGCHDKARYEALPRVTANPSVLTMQRPTGVILRDTAEPEPKPLSPIYPQGPKWPTSMPGVPFNHSLHERAMNCQDCHHTSVKKSCVTCHTAFGDPAAKNVTLAQAMHSLGSRNSCVNCHNRLTTASPECAGCHTPRPAKQSGQTCGFCHRAPAGEKTSAGLLASFNLPAKDQDAQAQSEPLPGDQDEKAAPGPKTPEAPDDPKARDLAPAPGAPQSAVSPPLLLGPPPAAKTQAKAQEPAAPAAQDRVPAPGASQSVVSPPFVLKPSAETLAAQAQAAKAGVKTPESPAAQDQDKAPAPGAPQDVVSPEPQLAPAPDGRPDKVRIAAMTREYRPVEFEHRKHLDKLHDAIARKSSGLLGLHAKNGTECAACHHHSPPLDPGMTPPRCSSCHAAAPTAATANQPDGRPTLKAAYHQRCMDCHTRMGLEKPKATDCQSCHAKREPGEAPVW